MHINVGHTGEDEVSMSDHTSLEDPPHTQHPYSHTQLGSLQRLSRSVTPNVHGYGYNNPSHPYGYTNTSSLNHRSCLATYTPRPVCVCLSRTPSL